MAGHSKFSNIKHRKGAQDKKRAKLFTKLIKEIVIAAKEGSADISANPKLRGAIATAKSQNLPKDRIEKALSSATDPSNNADYNEIRYEGFLPGGVSVIVETVTDNKNRTVAHVRSTLTKYGGSLGENGSACYMFDKIGQIIYPDSIDNPDNLLENLIEYEIIDIIEEENLYIIQTTQEKYPETLEFLTEKYGNSEEANIIWNPQNQIEITDKEKLEKLEKAIDILEDHDDIQDVFTNHINKTI